MQVLVPARDNVKGVDGAAEGDDAPLERAAARRRVEAKEQAFREARSRLVEHLVRERNGARRRGVHAARHRDARPHLRRRAKVGVQRGTEVGGDEELGGVGQLEQEDAGRRRGHLLVRRAALAAVRLAEI